MSEDDTGGEPTDSIADLFDKHAAKARGEERGDDEGAAEDDGGASSENHADQETVGAEADGFFDDGDDGESADGADDDGEGEVADEADHVEEGDPVEEAGGAEAVEAEDGADATNDTADAEGEVDDGRDDATATDVEESDTADDSDDTEVSDAAETDVDRGRPADDEGGAKAAGAAGETSLDGDTANGSGGIDESKLDADDGVPNLPAGTAIDRASPTGGRLTTGIDALDHHLGGGIPPGRIVSFVSTADTQSELLVKQLASQHDCLYLSTLRPKWEVQEEVADYIQKKAPARAGQNVQIEQLTADSRLDTARRHVEELDRRSIVVIDSMNELESLEKDRYAYFVDEVKRALWETGSVGLFYCIEEEQPPAGRAVTLRRADLIWQLRRSEAVGGIRHQLLISKFRGGRALIEPLTLWLTDEVVMDDGSDAS